MLDSDVGNITSDSQGRERFWAEQTRWFEEDLRRAQKADLCFVVFHHPPFTAMSSRQNSNADVRKLIPVFEKYKVHAVFNRHDHNYQHHPNNGVHYIVTGGGGAPLCDMDAPLPDITRKIEKVEHYVRVNEGGRQAGPH